MMLALTRPHTTMKSEMNPILINVNDVFVSSKARRKVDAKKVALHAARYENGEYVMPIDVRRVDDGYIISGNGRHRYFGAVEAGMDTIYANVLED